MRDWALALRRDGVSLSAISRATGVSRSTIRDWSRHPPRSRIDPRCFVCSRAPCAEPAAYTYLLGQYLGDGHLTTSVRVRVLRVTCADVYPGIAGEVRRATLAICGNRVGSAKKIGCTDVAAYWKHWPCVLPQHGPGRKHERPIILTAWQRQLVHADPWPLIRGLIHSDGCRSINRVHVRGKWYSYPRYLFANESRDILAIMGTALERAGVAWRYNRPNSISVARREAVALMDEHVGPKT